MPCHFSSADDFFSELGNKVEALERFHAPHSLSVEMAVNSTKRFLSKPEFRIDLMDLVTSEVENQLAVLNEDPYLKAHRDHQCAILFHFGRPQHTLTRYRARRRCRSEQVKIAAVMACLQLDSITNRPIDCLNAFGLSPIESASNYIQRTESEAAKTQPAQLIW
jgi:hypothetical protein